nr:MAG: hypothetical protein DIU72_12110 [Pseudomonadota bacterium]
MLYKRHFYVLGVLFVFFACANEGDAGGQIQIPVIGEFFADPEAMSAPGGTVHLHWKGVRLASG